MSVRPSEVGEQHPDVAFTIGVIHPLATCGLRGCTARRSSPTLITAELCGTTPHVSPRTYAARTRHLVCDVCIRGKVRINDVDHVDTVDLVNEQIGVSFRAMAAGRHVGLRYQLTRVFLSDSAARTSASQPVKFARTSHGRSCTDGARRGGSGRFADLPSCRQCAGPLGKSCSEGRLDEL